MAEVKTEIVKNEGVTSGPVSAALAECYNGVGISMRKMRSFESLPEKAWKLIDDEVVRVARSTLVGVRDLNSKPQMSKTFNGMRAQVYTIPTVSDLGEAYMAVSPDTQISKDALDFGSQSVPMVVTYKDFKVNTKQVAMASRAGIPFETILVSEAVRSVALKLDETLFKGNFYASGYNVYGYTTFPGRLTYTIPKPWRNPDTANEATPNEIFNDINEMINISIRNNHFGPWVLYIPYTVQARLNQDYFYSGAVDSSVISGTSIRTRLMTLPGLDAINMTQFLEDTFPITPVAGTYNQECVLVEMQPETVQLINGLPLTVGDWEPPGSKNWEHTFKAVAMSVPFIKTDYKGQCGIIHGVSQAEITT